MIHFKPYNELSHSNSGRDLQLAENIEGFGFLNFIFNIV
ncbi:hypothetical protein OENI_110009 [Oenococcus oeni]|nr:hypothetical protein OENI_110009 [Oenococcus oeni]SYW18813.1 hypothetical protein OENI_50159 [Oenococcus oeni]